MVNQFQCHFVEREITRWSRLIRLESQAVADLRSVFGIDKQSQFQAVVYVNDQWLRVARQWRGVVVGPLLSELFKPDAVTHSLDPFLGQGLDRNFQFS